MNRNTPQIGFDRFIKLEWVVTALKVRAGLATLGELNELLDASELGLAARKKTITVLNRLWLEPRAHLVEFADSGIELYKLNPNVSVVALTWGMAIASYPFFGKVAELVGRLSAIQGDCTSAEVHRRMSEVYGEREGTSRMTNMVLQSQVSWGTIVRTEKNKRLVKTDILALSDEKIIVWLIEAVIRYLGNAVSLTSLQSPSVLYPFLMDQSLAYAISNCANLEIRSEGADQFVYLNADH